MTAWLKGSTLDIIWYLNVDPVRRMLWNMIDMIASSHLKETWLKRKFNLHRIFIKVSYFSVSNWEIIFLTHFPLTDCHAFFILLTKFFSLDCYNPKYSLHPSSIFNHFNDFFVACILEVVNKTINSSLFIFLNMLGLNTGLELSISIITIYIIQIDLCILIHC